MITFRGSIYIRCFLSISSENIEIPKDLLIFSGGIDKQHRAAMGLKHEMKFLFR